MIKQELMKKLEKYFDLNEKLREMNDGDPERFSLELDIENLRSDIQKLKAEPLFFDYSDDEIQAIIEKYKNQIMKQMDILDLPLTFDDSIGKYASTHKKKVLDYLLLGSDGYMNDPKKNLRYFHTGISKIKLLKACTIVDQHYSLQTEEYLKCSTSISDVTDIINYQRQTKEETIKNNMDNILAFLYDWSNESITGQAHDRYCFHPLVKKSIDKIERDPKYMIHVLSNCCSNEELNQDPAKVLSKFEIRQK